MADRMLFAGMDVGTSGCKMLVYDLDGTIVYQSSRKYQEEGSDGYRELNPNLVMANVREVLKDVAKNCKDGITAMAVTSLGESVVCLDKDNKVLANSMLTGDCRGIPETQEIIDILGADRIFETTGLPPNELYGLPKYMWLNRNTNAVEDATAILYYEDFVGYILTGQRKVGYSSAVRSMAFDIRKFEWSEEFLKLAGIRKEQMSEPVPPCTVIGTILPEIAEELGLNKDLKIVAGGHDQTCAALGSGLFALKDGECGMGTCEFMFTMLPRVMMTPYMMRNDFTCIPYVFPDTYLSSIEVTTCGALKNWAKDSIFRDIDRKCREEGRNFFQYMDDLSRDVKTDVMVLPQFGSAGNPDLSMDARGTITGLTIHTKPEELYKAILEGMAFQMYLAYERMQELGTEMNCIAVTGGGAASELTLQIRADVFGMEVHSLESAEAGTLGCMLMSATAVNAYPSLEEGIKRAVKIKKKYVPEANMTQYYREKFERYKRFYEVMHDFH